MTDDELIAEIERKRKQREAELIALLLLWMDDAQQRMKLAIQQGVASVSFAAAMVNGFAQQPSIATLFAAGMVDAHLDSLDTIEQVSGVSVDRPADAELDLVYEQAARDASAAVSQQMASAYRYTKSAVASGESLDDAIAAAFAAIGYSDADSRNIASGAERTVVSASNAGLITGGIASGVVTALVHRSVLDSHTTEICRPRDGLILPVDDEFWKTNCPSLHFGCRSMLLPHFGPFEASEWRPTVQPDPGFGVMPVGFLQAIRGRN